MRDREPIEKASTSELRGVQIERLRRTLERANARVPRYRQSFDEERSQGKAKRVIDKRPRG